MLIPGLVYNTLVWCHELWELMSSKVKYIYIYIYISSLLWSTIGFKCGIFFENCICGKRREWKVAGLEQLNADSTTMHIVTGKNTQWSQ